VSECLRVDGVTIRETRALKALEAGEATPDQQRLALQAIIKGFARTHDQSFVPDEPASHTAFLEGRRFVGNQVLRHLKRPVSELHPDEVKDE